MAFFHATTNALRKGKIQLLRSILAKVGPEAATREPPPILKRVVAEHEEYLFSAALGAMSFQLLRAGYNIGLFKLLHERPGLTRSEIARSLGIEEYPAEILLLGLVPLHLVDKVGDQYFNNSFLSSTLSGEADEGGFGDIIEYFQLVINPAMIHLEEAIRKNKPVGLHKLFGEDTKSFYGALPKNPAYNRSFELAMRADTRFNRDNIAANPVFSQVKRVLDIGGNTGELAMAIARHHPNVHITIFDFPEVLEKARERIKAAGLEGRIDTVSGDLLSGGFPEGYDCVLFSHFLDIFSKARVSKFLKNAYDCLSPGGRVCVFGSVVADDERGPLMYGVFSSYFFCLADGEGRFYTAKQMTEMLSGVGFANMERGTLPKHEIVVVGRKT